VRVLDGSASFLYSGSNDRRTFMDASMGLAALSSAPKGAFTPMTATSTPSSCGRCITRQPAEFGRLADARVSHRVRRRQ
jgi:hypothetical protein